MDRQRVQHSTTKPTRILGAIFSIKGCIFFAFLAMGAVAVSLSLHAVLDLRHAGRLAAETYDQSTAANHARAAAADFNAIQAAFARRLLSADRATRATLDTKIRSLTDALGNDLTVAVDHAQSDRATKAGARVQRAVLAWSKLRENLTEGTSPAEVWRALDHHASVVEQQIDFLVNYTAGDALTSRQNAQSAVARAIEVTMIVAAVAVAALGLVALILGGVILRPVARASRTAMQIAAGHLDTPVRAGGPNEFAALLSAIEAMRSNIRASLNSEVAQRRSAQTRLADALESSREGVVVIDAGEKIVLANAQARAFLSDIVGSLRVGEAARDMLARLWAAVGPAPDGGSDMPPMREVQVKDGRWLRISQNATREGGAIVVCSDISVLKEQERALTATNQRFDVALANMSQGLCLYDADRRLQVFNRRFCEIFRLSTAHLHNGMVLEDVIKASGAVGNFLTDTEHRLSEAREVVARAEPVMVVLDLSDDRMVAVAHQPLREGGWIETYEDVTERLRSEAKIVYMARHDALTNLPNRLLFSERVEQALASMGRGDDFALLCLDLDHFKQVNDTLGHPFGDALLRAVAERLVACVREVDTVARLGGDEFAVVQMGLHSPDDATVLARRIVETLKVPFDLDGHRIAIGASIGISLAPSDGSSYGTLLKNADVALYKAKSDGRDTWRFFELEMDARLQARRALEIDLREALAGGGFELHYQPLFDFKRNQIGSFEALIRWNHPTRGMISPSEFIPIAEEIGLINQLGEWVLKHACREAKTWPNDIKVAVNVSPAQFRAGQLALVVAGALAQTGLSADRLELEVTESVILASTGSTMATLTQLRDLGVKIAMDDFGTGYSSLSYLRSFPFDKVKIDQSFIRDLDAKTDSSVIVGAIVGLCKSLGMRVAAEGVETQAQLDFLFWEGCNEAQGYYFSRPISPERVPALIKKWIGGAELFETPEQRLLAG